MMVRPAEREIAAATLGLSILWTAMNRWVISSTVISSLGDLVHRRVVLIATDQRVDDTVERGREQQRLVLALDVAEDPLDLGQEAHVGHAVGLVDDDVGDVGDRDRLALDQVDHAARGGDHEIDALVEHLDLLLDRGAAVDGEGPTADGLGQPARVLR